MGMVAMADMEDTVATVDMVMVNTVVVMVVMDMDVVMGRDQLKLNQDMEVMDLPMCTCIRQTMDMDILNHTAMDITFMEESNSKNIFNIY